MSKRQKPEEIIIEENEEDAGLAGKIKKIKQELKKCQKEKTEYLTGWQRAKADFINARKEEEKNREEFIKFAEKDLVLELLDVIDSFEAVLGNKKLWSKLDKDWQDGIKNIYNQLAKILKEHNVSVIKAQGQAFNPEEQESVESLAVDEQSQDQMVIEEVSKGYKLDNKVLRPARVKIGNYKNNN